MVQCHGSECDLAQSPDNPAARKALDKTFYAMLGCMIEEGDQPVSQVSEMLVKFA
jgi:hypothetical protein